MQQDPQQNSHYPPQGDPQYLPYGYYPEQQPFPQWQPPMSQPQYGYPQQPFPQQYPPPNYPQQPFPQQQWTPYPPQMPYYPQQMMMYPPMQQNMVVQVQVPRQSIPAWIRILYFLLVGWWLGILWASIALCLICTIIGAPVGIVMLAMTGKIFAL